MSHKVNPEKKFLESFARIKTEDELKAELIFIDRLIKEYKQEKESIEKTK